MKIMTAGDRVEGERSCIGKVFVVRHNSLLAQLSRPPVIPAEYIDVTRHVIQVSGVRAHVGQDVRSGFFAAVAAGFCLYAAMLVHAVSGVETPNAALATTS
jgi:hypothetical protein